MTDTQKIKEALQKTSALLKAMIEITGMNLEITIKTTDGKEIPFDAEKVLEENTRILTESKVQNND